MAAERDDAGTARLGPGARREEWLREKAETAPRPLRIFFEAELGYSAWAASSAPGNRARRRAEARRAAARARLAMVPDPAGV
ncbi:MAG: hypothetical protein ACRD03_10810, partial [Acidimicrobiales bacterium]